MSLERTVRQGFDDFESMLKSDDAASLKSPMPCVVARVRAREKKIATDISGLRKLGASAEQLELYSVAALEDDPRAVTVFSEIMDQLCGRAPQERQS